jgi:hypothetical protein
MILVKQFGSRCAMELRGITSNLSTPVMGIYAWEGSVVSIWGDGKELAPGPQH